jgi:hypothetical protein
METSDCAEDFDRREAAKASTNQPVSRLRMPWSRSARRLDQKVSHAGQQHDQEHDRYFCEKQKLLVGLCMLGVVHRRIAARQVDRHVSPPSGSPLLKFLVPQHKAAIKPISACAGSPGQTIDPMCRLGLSTLHCGTQMVSILM